jgi:predicted nucleic acid-binding protein
MILRSPTFVVVAIQDNDWVEALSRWQAARDKEWSLVDCHSMMLCERRAITLVFTADRHFTQGGFVALLSASSR